MRAIPRIFFYYTIVLTKLQGGGVFLLQPHRDLFAPIFVIKKSLKALDRQKSVCYNTRNR